MSVGDTPTPTRTDDGDADSYYDAESGLCSPAPPASSIKPQVTIHVEKSVDETVSDVVVNKVCCAYFSANSFHNTLHALFLEQNPTAASVEASSKVESVKVVSSSPQNTMHKRQSRQFSTNNGPDKKVSQPILRIVFFLIA
jgi:hypothetical protein